MTVFLDILFAISIFVSIWMTLCTVALYFRNQAVPPLNFILQAASYTAVITRIIGMWG